MNGNLGKAMTVAATNIVVYTVPVSGVNFATFTIAMVNQGPLEAMVRVGLGTGAAPTPADMIEFDSIIPASGGVFERTCVIASPGEKVFIYCDRATVSVRVMGLEDLIVID